ncbi:MAG TPA: amidase family protein [Haliangiales bacterium]|nr:amidase family protein [Haliangiales bacterium]
MSSLLESTLLELVEALAARRASPVELMRETLARVRATADRLNAVVARRDDDELLAAAGDAEARIARGEARPLEGVPFGVKDLEDAAGLPTTYGSLPFRDAPPATRDSTQVARLRAAGAIVLGKTNTPELGYTAITKNLVFGPTLSPWDAARSPGGSSGGSAAALAGEVLPLVTASDGGGSIRIPASFVGAFGLKPSFGRVPRGPLPRWDHGATAVYGPLTKTVEDAAFLLDVVAGPDARDPRSLPPPEASFVDAVRRPLARGLRVAYSPDLGHAVVQGDVAAAVAAGARAFEELGCAVEEIRGGPPDLGAHWGILGAFELAGHIAGLRPQHDASFSRALMEGIRMAEHVTPRWWGELCELRADLVEWVAGVFDEFDLLVTPTAPFDPPAAKGPFPAETEGRRQPATAVAAFTIPFNLSWNPAASVRAGLSRAGLPVGLQIVGPQHADALVLQAARAFERARPWHPAWPMRGA